MVKGSITSEAENRSNDFLFGFKEVSMTLMTRFQVSSEETGIRDL